LTDAHHLVENFLNNETVYDVIFLDINLDGVSGETICQELREQPQLTTTKIIAVTAATSPADLRLLQAAGFDGVVPKPLDLNTFSAKLSSILAGEQLWEV
jgi:CheY-like chemotaxis protein